MTIPSADELRSIFAAAREHGVTHLRVGGLEVRLALAPPSPALQATAPQCTCSGPAGTAHSKPCPVWQQWEDNEKRAAGNAYADLLAAQEAKAPLPGEDPVATLRREADRDLKRTLVDPLEVISSGGRLLQDAAVGS